MASRRNNNPRTTPKFVAKKRVNKNIAAPDTFTEDIPIDELTEDHITIVGGPAPSRSTSTSTRTLQSRGSRARGGGVSGGRKNNNNNRKPQPANHRNTNPSANHMSNNSSSSSTNNGVKTKRGIPKPEYQADAEEQRIRAEVTPAPRSDHQEQDDAEPGTKKEVAVDNSSNNVVTKRRSSNASSTSDTNNGRRKSITQHESNKQNPAHVPVPSKASAAKKTKKLNVVVAATRIQRWWRMHHARDSMRKMKLSTLTIQRHARGFLARRQLAKLRDEHLKRLIRLWQHTYYPLDHRSMFMAQNYRPSGSLEPGRLSLLRQLLNITREIERMEGVAAGIKSEHEKKTRAKNLLLQRKQLIKVLGKELNASRKMRYKKQSSAHNASQSLLNEEDLYQRWGMAVREKRKKARLMLTKVWADNRELTLEEAYESARLVCHLTRRGVAFNNETAVRETQEAVPPAEANKLQQGELHFVQHLEQPAEQQQQQTEKQQQDTEPRQLQQDQHQKKRQSTLRYGVKEDNKPSVVEDDAMSEPTTLNVIEV